jgi:hypothetical protein
MKIGTKTAAPKATSGHSTISETNTEAAQLLSWNILSTARLAEPFVGKVEREPGYNMMHFQQRLSKNSSLTKRQDNVQNHCISRFRSSAVILYS